MLDRDALLAVIGEAMTSGQHVACVETPTYFTSEVESIQRVATAWCHGCPVMVQCRAFGLTHLKEYGVYGGYTDKERAVVARKRKAREGT